MEGCTAQLVTGAMDMGSYTDVGQERTLQLSALQAVLVSVAFSIQWCHRMSVVSLVTGVGVQLLAKATAH